MNSAQVIASYEPQLPYFSQQLAALEASLSKRFFALFMEQGTGKTKVIIDTAAIHYEAKHITGLLISAPIDVHEQWIIEQIPTHMPSRIKVRACIWNASSARQRRECNELIARPRTGVLSILSMNHEAFATNTGLRLAKAFLKAYPSLFALDESDLAIKTPRAARTKNLVHRVGPEAFMRRILTGTPAENPFDLYSQFNFLDERIINQESFLTFKHRYAKWTKNFARGKPNAQTGIRKLIEFETLEGYQNLDELNDLTAPYIYSCRKVDCLDLPPKLYDTCLVSLSPAQREVYNTLAEQGLVMIEQAAPTKPDPLKVIKFESLTEEELLQSMSNDKGKTSAELKLTLMLRLQQCVGGFLTDDESTTRAIDGEALNPRMRRMLDLSAGGLARSAKVIVWAIFRAELALLAQLIREHLNVEVASIYGGTHTKTQRAHDIAEFKNPDSSLRVLVAHPLSLGVGMNFTVAQTEVFYSCGASFRQRIQAEDRCHRIGQKGTVNIYDLDAHEVPTDAVMRKFRETKEDFNTSVMGWNIDKLKAAIGATSS